MPCLGTETIALSRDHISELAPTESRVTNKAVSQLNGVKDKY